MINKQDVEKFLVNKYGTDIFKYKAFRYIRDIIAGNEDYIMGNTIQEYAIIAAAFDETEKSVERAIRNFKEVIGKCKVSNTVFINNLIFEFKEWNKTNDKSKHSNTSI